MNKYILTTRPFTLLSILFFILGGVLPCYGQYNRNHNIGMRNLFSKTSVRSESESPSKSKVSTEIADRNGKLFYLHTFLPTDTIESLIEAYNTTKDDIIYYNPIMHWWRKGQDLGGTILRIPLSEQAAKEYKSTILKHQEPLQSQQTNYTNTFTKSNSPSVATLIVSGEAATKEEATKLALRSAIEQTYGVFVSANTEVVNDEIVRDEIATIASGNILEYSEIGCVSKPNGNQFVTLSATVSIGNLITYAKQKGFNVEFAGAKFAMTIKIKELNRQNEIIAIENMYKQLDEFASNNYLFYYDFKAIEPYAEDATNDKYVYGCTIIAKPRENMKELMKIVDETMVALSVSSLERDEYKKLGLEAYKHTPYRGDYQSCRTTPGEVYLRNMHDLYNYQGNKIDNSKWSDKNKRPGTLLDRVMFYVVQSLFKYRILIDYDNNKSEVISNAYCAWEQCPKGWAYGVYSRYKANNESEEIGFLSTKGKYLTSFYTDLSDVLYQKSPFDSKSMIKIEYKMTESLENISKITNIRFELTPSIREVHFE